MALTEWTVLDTSSGDDVDVNATKAGEVGSTHYITSCTCSCDNSSTSTAGGSVHLKLYHTSISESKLLFEVWPSTTSGGGAPCVMNFTHPIKMVTGKPAILVGLMPASTDDQLSVCLMGYTTVDTARQFEKTTEQDTAGDVLIQKVAAKDPGEFVNPGTSDGAWWRS